MRKRIGNKPIPKIHKPAVTNHSKPRKLAKREVPKSELNLNVDQTLSISTLRRLNSERDVVIKMSRNFQDVPPKEYTNLFLSNVLNVQLFCDFSSPKIDAKAKVTKATLLKQLASCFSIPHLIRNISLESMKEFHKMLSINLFRTLPKMPAINVVGAHDSMLDSAWPHISLAYNCLLASLNCRHSSNISSSFIYNLVRNCSSPDDRERIAVRDILHTLYTKYMNLRSIVRDKVAAHFAIGNCSTEILEFFVSVVTGFNSPLNPSHITYYYNAILPIHTLENYPTFQAQYVQLILRYITKSGFLLDRTVNYLLMHWPKSCRQKQILFLSEIEELLENFEINVTPQMATSVFKLISKMTMNLNSDVAETAINILMNPKVSFLLKTHASTLYPIIVKYVYKSAKNHWDECIRTNAFVTLQGLSELDSQTFNKVNETLKVRKAKKANQFKANWTEIFEGAKAFDRNIKPI